MRTTIIRASPNNNLSTATQLPPSSSTLSMTAPFLPALPITCLTTAKDLNTQEAFQGQNTVIDFWTTKCTRCPDALDKLNSMAKDPEYANVKFVSICCDKLDGAREIIEQSDEPRWKNMSHYFMEHEQKEQAKKLLGFRSVPFYVVLNDKGEMTQKGSSKQVNFDDIPGIIRPESMDKENMKGTKVVEERPVEQAVAVVSPENSPAAPKQVFTLDADF